MIAVHVAMLRVRVVVGLVGVLGFGSATADPVRLRVAADVALPFDAHDVTIAGTSGLPRLIADGVVMVASSKGWVRRPTPAGLVVTSRDGALVTMEATGGRLRLEETGWVATASGRALPRGVHRPASLDATGKLIAFGDNFTALWREAADGQFTRSPVPPRTVLGSFAGAGAVFAISQAGVTGSTTLDRPLATMTGHPTGGVDRLGAVAIAWSSAGALRLRAGGEATVGIPPDDKQPDPSRCLDKPCVVARRWVDLAAGAGVLARGAELLVPFVDATFTEHLTCVNNPEPPRPCDPSGPNGRCAPRQPYVCSGPRALRGTLGLMRATGTRAERVVLPALTIPRDRAPDLLAAALDQAGRLHLVVRWHDDEKRQEGTLRYVVLSERDERYVVPTTLVPAAPIALTTLSSTSLGLAGFRDDGPDTVRPEPRFKNGEAHTGGRVGPGWWLASLSAPEAQSIGFESSLGVTPATCGRPGLVLQFGVARLAVRISLEGLEVEIPGRPMATLPRAKPPTTLRLELGRDRSKIVVDGEEVASGGGLGEATVSGTAVFGDQAGCSGPQAVARWRSVRLTP